MRIGRTGRLRLSHATCAAIGLLLLFLSLVLCPSDTLANDTYWSSERRVSCPPGYRAPITLGQSVLYVDFRMITHLELGGYPAPAEPCPTSPVSVTLIYFYYKYKELALLYKEMDLPLSRLTVEVGTDKSIWRLPFPTFTDKKFAVGDAGFIEDVTDRTLFVSQPTLGRRAYLLQHSSMAERGEPILVICSGNPQGSPPRRDCEADYFIEPGLVIRYVVRQDARDRSARSWQIPPDGPIQEPEGLLEIDRKVRSLIAYFKSSP